MAKRFTSTEIWDEDWFLDMPNEYKLFWYYMLAACDHAGLFRVNASKFNRSISSAIKTDEALEFFNAGKKRIREISKSVWLIEEFFLFQYGEKFNVNNPMHKSILEKYKIHSINILEVRGLKDHNLTSKRGEEEVKQTTKDKVKDIDKVKDSIIQDGGVGEGASGNTLGNEHFSPDKRFIVPEMQKVFKKNVHGYHEDQELDSPPLLAIAGFILRQEKLEGSVITNMDKILIKWAAMSAWINNDPFYCQKSLKSISNCIQEISNKTQNGTTKQPTSSAAKNGNTVASRAAAGRAKLQERNDYLQSHQQRREGDS